MFMGIGAVVFGGTFAVGGFNEVFYRAKDRLEFFDMSIGNSIFRSKFRHKRAINYKSDKSIFFYSKWHPYSRSSNCYPNIHRFSSESAYILNCNSEF